MKKYLAIFLFLSACASTAVHMSREETAEFIKSHPDLLEAMRNTQEAEKRYKHVYFHCDKPQDQQCRKVDCRGLTDEMNCWKSSIPREEVPANILASFEGKSDSNQHQKICEDQNEPVPNRKRNCFEFVNSADLSKEIEPSLRALKIFCDFDGTSCRKNGKKMGTGRLPNNKTSAALERTLKIYPRNSKSTDIYEYTYFE